MLKTGYKLTRVLNYRLSKEALLSRLQEYEFDFTSDHDGNTPLHTLMSLVVTYDYSILVFILEKFDIDINARNNDGFTAYDLAIQKRRYLNAIILSQYGAVPSDKLENTLLAQGSNIFDFVKSTLVSYKDGLLSSSCKIIKKIYEEALSANHHMLGILHSNSQSGFLDVNKAQYHFDNSADTHYKLSIVYNNPQSKIYDPDRAFEYLLSCNDYLPAQKDILPFYIADSTEDGKIVNPESFALALQAATNIIAKEPSNREANAFLQREKFFPKSIKMTGDFNRIISQPIKSSMFFIDLSRRMYCSTLSEAKSHGDENAQHEFDKHWGLTLKPDC